MSVSAAFQKWLVDTLAADPAVSGFVGDRVYDGAPADAAFPYLSLDAGDFTPADADGIVGREETVQIDIWARENGRLRPAKEIADAIRTLLEGRSADLEEGALVDLTLGVRVVRDPDGISAHGIVTVTALIDEAYV